MTQSESKDKNMLEQRSSAENKNHDNDSAMVSVLERLAFKLHDLANRLLRYIS